MIYGYQIPATGTDQLWKLNGGAPNQISLQTPIVDGIDADLPVFASLKLRMRQIAAGAYGAVFQYLNGTKDMFNGILSIAGAQSAGMKYEDTATGIFISRSINTNNKIRDILSIPASNVAYDSSIGASGIIKSYSDNATNNKVSLQWDAATQVFRVFVANVEVMNYGVNANGFIVTDGTNQRFRIAPNGNIQTDQTQAPGVHVVLAAELPVYNMAGALVGYVPVMT